MNVAFLPIRKVFIWLGLIVGLVYVGSLHGSFHFDDSHSVEANLAIRSVANIPSFWADSRTSSFIPENRVYRPMVYTLYSFCWAIGEGKTWPFHIMKMAMHVLVCLALFLVWRMLWSVPGWFPVKSLSIKFPLVSHVFSITPDWAAFFLAAVFAVHPAGSECVDYISATTSLQCAMFYVWAVYFYLGYRSSALGLQPAISDDSKKKYFWFALLFYFLSVASKEEGITLPAVIVLFELFLNKGALKTRVSDAVRIFLPFALLGVILAGWIYIMHPPEGNESRGWVTPFNYFITQWRAYLWYMRLWFWPWDLNADVAAIEFSKSVADPLVIQAAIGNLLILVFSWLNRRRFPAMLFGILWFYITISPASSIVVLAEAINEHRMYLAYFGFVGGTFTILLWCAENFFAAATRATRLGLWLLLIGVGLVIGTQERNRVWLNDENLWSDTVEKNPTSGRALNNLALVYLGRGEYEKTIGLLDKCEQYWSTYSYCPLNKGISLFALKRFDEAEIAFQKAYGLNPTNLHINYHLGRLQYDHKMDYKKAIEYFRASVDVTGGRYPEGDIYLALSHEKLGQYKEAKDALSRALSIEPDNQSALFNLARMFFSLKEYDASIKSYERLIGLNQQHQQAWYNYGVAKLEKNDFKGAKTAFERTLVLDPKSEQALFNLAFVNEKLGDGVSAIKAINQLLVIDPNRADYKNRLNELNRKFGVFK